MELMGVFRALLLAGTDTGNTVQGPDANAWRDQLFNVLVVVFAFAAAAITLWAVFLGFKMASATDEGSRGQAKSRFFKALSAVFIIAVLFAMSLAIKFVWLPPVDPNLNTNEQPENQPPPEDNGEPIPEGQGILDAVNAPSKVQQQGSNNCKAVAVSILLNIMFNSNQYDYSNKQPPAQSSLLTGPLSEKPACDGRRYSGYWQYDTNSGSLNEVRTAINNAIVKNRVPIMVMVKPNSANSGQHWVVVYGVSGSTYQVLDPNGKKVRLMSESEIGVPAGVGGDNSKNYDRYAYCSVHPK